MITLTENSPSTGSRQRGIDLSDASSDMARGLLVSLYACIRKQNTTVDSTRARGCLCQL
jgi:hypothetical protein